MALAARADPVAARATSPRLDDVSAPAIQPGPSSGRDYAGGVVRFDDDKRWPWARQLRAAHHRRVDPGALRTELGAPWWRRLRFAPAGVHNPTSRVRKACWCWKAMLRSSPLFVRRSFAAYIAEWLLDAMREYRR